MKRLLLIGFVLLSACDALPRDPDGTLERAARDKSFLVGFASPDIAKDPRAASLVRAVEAETHAKARVVGGSGEPLLARLENGDVDLVIGRFKKDSPWQTEIAFGPVLATSGEASDPVELKAAMRNGENRWIMHIERASRSVAGEQAE